MKQQTFPVQISELVSLRPFAFTDAPSLARHANNLAIARNLNDAFPHPYTLNDAKDFIQRRKAEPFPTVLAIEIKGEAAGAVGLFLQQGIQKKNAELGYWISEEYWGKGMGTSVVEWMIKYAFSTFDLLRLYARPFPFNIASQRVLEKNGFKLEAILKSALYKDNIVYDEWIYSILKSELNEEFS